VKPVAISAVLDWIESEGAVLRVVPSTEITGFASVDLAGPGDASFWLGDTVKSATNANGFASSLLDSVRIGLLFVPRSIMPAVDATAASGKEFAPGVGCIVPVENPYHAMVCFLERFVAGDVADGSFAGISFAGSECAGHVAKSARVHASAVVEGRVGENAVVGPGCVVMRGATLGAGCVLEANVTVYPNVVVGEDCVFQAGTVIGSRGFGFYEYEGRRRPVPHLAGVRIGRGCSFGANTVVAAGFLSPTTIGDNCHFDSFVQIAHNCRLGNNIYMASQSGLAGSVTVEDDVELAGGAQVANHLTLGKGARIAAKAGVTKSIPAGLTVSGFPAEEITVWRRSMVRLRQMGKK
jgi:UDP-3-O-[3-hydroxymyristoyl] glucosamine N-acyltransferase